MAKKKKKKSKIRAEFRKSHQTRTRQGNLTREFQEHGFEQQDTERGERVSGKGQLTRKRTIVGAEVTEDETGLLVHLDVDEEGCLKGRVLSVHGLSSKVAAEDGQLYHCATRRLLKSLSTDQRHVVAAGDRVLIRPADNLEGFIERVEPRRGVLCRTSRQRQHVLVTNVDQVLIVTSAAEPALKPNLIDRFLVTAEKAGITPIICINKIDLIECADLMPLVGVYSRMGYRVILLSATDGAGLDQLKQCVRGKESVVTGQSGVGKTSLLNAIDPGLGLRVGEVSSENQKGRHTTTSAQLIPMSCGGYVVDTPGIRQFQLWDVIPEEVAGFYRDIRSYVSLCRYPDCTHTHEVDCAVKHAVADGRVDLRRYESYCYLHAGEMP